MTYPDKGHEEQQSSAEDPLSDYLGETGPTGDEGQDTDKLHARVNVALSEESFRALVVNDAKAKVSEEERQFLRSPSVLGRWNAVLGSLNRELQSQFAERRAEAQSYRNECMKAGPKAKQEWFDYQARYESWRGSATRFKGLIEERLAESKELIRQQKRRRGSSKASQAPNAAQDGHAAANSLPLLSDVAELLSNEGAVREPFAGQRDWLLRRIAETFRLVRGRPVTEEAACAGPSGGACTEPNGLVQQHATEHKDVRGGSDG